MNWRCMNCCITEVNVLKIWISTQENKSRSRWNRFHLMKSQWMDLRGITFVFFYVHWSLVANQSSNRNHLLQIEWSNTVSAMCAKIPRKIISPSFAAFPTEKCYRNFHWISNKRHYPPKSIGKLKSSGSLERFKGFLWVN